MALVGTAVDVGAVFDALGDATRRAIVDRLRDGPRAVGELAADLPVSRPAVSKHLKLLKDAGLVTGRPDGTRRLYSLELASLAAARDELDRFWDDALARFQHLAGGRGARSDRRRAGGTTMTETTTAATTTAPIVKTLELACSAEHAAEVFFGDIGAWWPLATHHVTDRPRTVTFEPREGGWVYETAEDGTEARWGQVRAWDPPARVVWSWQVTAGNPATEVEVGFTDLGDGRCRLRLEHRGWEAFADPARRAEVKRDYLPGWDVCLGRFAERATS